jgi:hypothetical protein
LGAWNVPLAELHAAMHKNGNIGGAIRSISITMPFS